MKNLTNFWTFIRKQPSEQNFINVIIDKCALFLFYLYFFFLHDSQLFIFTISSICSGFTFYFNVVISNSFNFIFETDVLRDSFT